MSQVKIFSRFTHNTKLQTMKVVLTMFAEKSCEREKKKEVRARLNDIICSDG